MTNQNKSLKKGQQKMPQDSITTKTMTLSLKSHHKPVKSDQISLDTNNNNNSSPTAPKQVKSGQSDSKNKH